MVISDSGSTFCGGCYGIAYVASLLEFTQTVIAKATLQLETQLLYCCCQPPQTISMHKQPKVSKNTTKTMFDNKNKNNNDANSDGSEDDGGGKAPAFDDDELGKPKRSRMAGAKYTEIASVLTNLSLEVQNQICTTLPC